MLWSQIQPGRYLDSSRASCGDDFPHTVVEVELSEHGQGLTHQDPLLCGLYFEAESVLAKSGLGRDPSSLISDRADGPGVASAARRADPAFDEGSNTLSFSAVVTICVGDKSEETAS